MYIIRTLLNFSDFDTTKPAGIAELALIRLLIEFKLKNFIIYKYMLII